MNSANSNIVSVAVADAPLTAQGKFLAAPHGAPVRDPGKSDAVVASFTDADPNGVVADYSASIDWGDGTALATGTIIANSKGFDVHGTHTYAAPGAHTATITIHDVGGSSAVAMSPVADDYPLILTARRLHFRAGQNFMLMLGTITDTDPTANGSSLSASIDWGDGTSSSGSLVAQTPGFAIMGMHTYTSVRVFTVTITVTDSDGGAKAVSSTPATLWPLPRAF